MVLAHDSLFCLGGCACCSCLANLDGIKSDSGEGVVVPSFWCLASQPLSQGSHSPPVTNSATIDEMGSCCPERSLGLQALLWSAFCSGNPTWPILCAVLNFILQSRAELSERGMEQGEPIIQSSPCVHTGLFFACPSLTYLSKAREGVFFLPYGSPVAGSVLSLLTTSLVCSWGGCQGRLRAK